MDPAPKRVKLTTATRLFDEYSLQLIVQHLPVPDILSLATTSSQARRALCKTAVRSPRPLTLYQLSTFPSAQWNLIACTLVILNPIAPFHHVKLKELTIKNQRSVVDICIPWYIVHENVTILRLTDIDFAGQVNLDGEQDDSQSLTIDGGLRPLLARPGITELDLSCERLDSLRMLAGLTKLQRLDLRMCISLTDVKSLANCLDLRSLNLQRSQVENLGSLSRLAHLHTINLEHCSELRDVSLLGQCPNLMELRLTGCRRLTNVNGLHNSTSLHFVHLDNCVGLIDTGALEDIATLLLINVTESPAVRRYDLGFRVSESPAVRRRDIRFRTRFAHRVLEGEIFGTVFGNVYCRSDSNPVFVGDRILPTKPTRHIEALIQFDHHVCDRAIACGIVKDNVYSFVVRPFPRDIR